MTDHRDLVIERLSSDYANGHIEVEELERRLALVHAAKTPAELDALAPAPPVTALVAAQRMRVVLGSIERVGPWTVPAQLTARVLWGHVLLDLRAARLAPDTTIEVDVTMGNLEVIAPPDVRVEVDASSVLGHVEDRTELGTATRAVVRVVGRVKLGNLEVRTLRHGETPRDARRRRRADRRAYRHYRRHLPSFLD